MLEGGKISPIQLVLLLIGSRLIIDLTINYAFLAPPANQDVWISTILSSFVSLIFVFPILFLGKKYPDMNIIQYSELLLGRIVGKIVGLLYIWLFLHVSADAVRVCGEYFTTAPMPETPLLVFLLTIVLVTAYAAYNGLEVVARMSEIIMPLILLAVLIIGFLVFKEIEFKNLKPVLEDGILPVFHGAVTSASRGIEPLLLAMLSPYLNDKKRKTVSYVIALSVFTIILTIIDIQILTSLGANQAKVFTFPYINLMRRINFADIIERIELIYIGIWLLGVILKVSLYFYLAALGSAQLFNLKSYKPIVLPVGVIIVLLSVFLYRNLVQMSEFFSYKILTPYNLFFILVIPLFLLMVSLIKKSPQKHRRK